MPVTSQDLRDAIEQAGLSRHAVCLHSSLRSFGRVVGGAETVLEAFLAAGCTVLVPSFSWSFAMSPPPHLRPARNGWPYSTNAGPAGRIDRRYTPDVPDVDRAMGAIPAAVVAHPRRVRGDHPLCSFCAVGSLAEQLIAGQKVGDVFAPLAALARLDGIVVLIGVDLTSMTLLHLAEQRAGRTLFRRWANDRRGEPIMVDAGGCSDGFMQFEPVLEAYRRTVKVGNSRWGIYPAAETLQAATAAIRANPRITHCGQPGCDRCQDAIAGGPLLDA